MPKTLNRNYTTQHLGITSVERVGAAIAIALVQRVVDDRVVAGDVEVPEGSVRRPTSAGNEGDNADDDADDGSSGDDSRRHHDDIGTSLPLDTALIALLVTGRDAAIGATAGRRGVALDRSVRAAVQRDTDGLGTEEASRRAGNVGVDAAKGTIARGGNARILVRAEVLIRRVHASKGVVAMTNRAADGRITGKPRYIAAASGGVARRGLAHAGVRADSDFGCMDASTIGNVARVIRALIIVIANRLCDNAPRGNIANGSKARIGGGAIHPRCLCTHLVRTAASAET